MDQKSCVVSIILDPSDKFFNLSFWIYHISPPKVRVQQTNKLERKWDPMRWYTTYLALRKYAWKDIYLIWDVSRSCLNQHVIKKIARLFYFKFFDFFNPNNADFFESIRFKKNWQWEDSKCRDLSKFECTVTQVCPVWQPPLDMIMRHTVIIYYLSNLELFMDQMFGFYLKCNARLNWVNRLLPRKVGWYNFFLFPSRQLHVQR